MAPGEVVTMTEQSGGAKGMAKLSDHPWIGLFVCLTMGVFLIGGGAYFWAWRSQSERELDRGLNEQVTGGKLPAPDQGQSAREWKRNMIAGAAVGGVVWVGGRVWIAIQIWRERARNDLRKEDKAEGRR
jgi:hypothetical protein